MSILRPSCAAIAQRLCKPQTHLDRVQSLPLWSLVLPRRTIAFQNRTFSCSPRIAAKVIDTPHNTTNPQTRKRTVRIGPLPGGRVDDATITRIFGRKLSVEEGNNVLRILQHRRTAGSLADYGVDNLGNQFTHVKRDLALKGLEWLRERYPIDEARAAEEWAEKEANRISYELWLSDPETESKYKDPARAFKEQMEKEEQARQQDAHDNQKMGILHVGKSQFERNIEEKRKERLEAVTRKAEEKEARERDMEAKLATGEWVRTPTGTQLMKPGQTTYVDVFGREQVSRRKEEQEKYSKLSETTTAQTAEELLSKTTLVQRLYPMTAFVFFTVLLSYGFAHYYLAPSAEYRLFPDLSLTTATIATLIAVNAMFAIGWRIMPLWPIMTRYFMHVPGYPRAFQAIGNIFSHIQYEHLLSNMMMLSLVGFVCHDLVGRGVFMGTYMSAGAVGTLASLYWANIGRGSITSHSVGASAAIWGISALYCLLTDAESIKIPFVKDLEVTFWPKMLFAAFVVFEIMTAMKKNRSMDHASHFGGMFVGITTAGYMRATGFHEKRLESMKAEGAQSKTVEPAAIAKETVNEVKDALSKKSTE